MIIVRLMGGLGNQMFQYAAGCALADSRGTELKLDISLLQGSHRGFTPREYSLGHFNISAQLASTAEIRRLTGQSGIAVVDRFLKFCRKRGWLQKSPHVVCEQSCGGDLSTSTLPGEVYLDGYWQSERHFKGVADRIRQQFTVKEELSGNDSAVAEQMACASSVSLHIRRGDYVKDPQIKRIYDVCTLDYYQRAIAAVSQRVGALHLFVFSDDCTWARQNLQSEHPITFVDHNAPDRSYRDLLLMSLCRHHIIANSSFSWWGAWLNPEPAKIVVAPRTWASDGSIDSRQIVPPQWIML